MNDERKDHLLAFYYLSISISPERPRLGLLIFSGWEFGHRLHILDKPFLFNWWLFLLLLSHSVVSDSLLLHGLKNDRLLCPSLSPRVCSNSCPSSQWCHLTISSSAVPFSTSLQSFPASGSFAMNQFFISGGQSIGASASASVLSVNIQGWFPLGLSGLISLQSKGLSRAFSNTAVQKLQFFGAQLSL